MDDKPLIEPEKMPLFTAVAFTVALLALVVSFTAIYRTSVVAGGTQLEVLALSKRIDSLSKTPVPPVASAEPVTPAQPK
jgi:hypothetical protein